MGRFIDAASVPDSIKAELLQRIRTFLVAAALWLIGRGAPKKEEDRVEHAAAGHPQLPLEELGFSEDEPAPL